MSFKWTYQTNTIRKFTYEKGDCTVYEDATAMTLEVKIDTASISFSMEETYIRFISLVEHGQIVERPQNRNHLIAIGYEIGKALRENVTKQVTVEGTKAHAFRNLVLTHAPFTD